MNVTFASSWCATDLGQYRPCRFTYEHYPIDTLPPLDGKALDGKAFDGSFTWFGDVGAVVSEWQTEMNTLSQALADAGLVLPEDFVTFHAHAELRDSFARASCTGCWSDLSEPLPSPVEAGAYVVRFLRDSQDCVLWYLYLRPSGETFIVHSYELVGHLDYLAPDERWRPEEKSELEVDDLTSHIFWCAATFEEFAYRFLIENRIWDVAHRGGDFDPQQRAYLSHYGLGASA